MKLLNVFLAIFLFYSCSFDNKSGIWKNEDALTKKIKNTDDFVDLNKILNDNYFNKTVNLDKNFSFKLSKTKIIILGLIHIMMKLIILKIFLSIV